MKAFVTGSTGFIGSHLVEFLVRQGYRVTCLVRKTSDVRWLNQQLNADTEPIELVTADIGDYDTLAQLVKDTNLVFHLAGLTKAADAATYNRVNVQGTKNLINACLRTNSGLDRFVYCSSLAAMGPCSTATPMTEDASPQPLTDYGRSKLKGEFVTYECANRLPITIIRPPAVYGPRDTDVFLYFQFVEKGLMPTLGDEDRLLSLIHVRDLVAGIYAAAVSNLAIGEAYFLTDGALHSWNDVGNTIAYALKKCPLRLKVPYVILDMIAMCTETAARITRHAPTLNRQKIRELKQRFWICDSTKAQQQLGFAPAYPLEKGIQETAEWYRESCWL
ncbi:MAG: SDR family NAD(P)-dependent oxidoreductase [Candidatus Poribacteria bacterium]|nr:SDR family NAD(P)-dependent oxidoreductase [Candidatus Poribacteria bacterium]